MVGHLDMVVGLTAPMTCKILKIRRVEANKMQSKI